MRTSHVSSHTKPKDIILTRYQDEGMPMVYWVTSEAPATLVSICLPPMINLIKQVNGAILSPLSSKISAIWSTYTTNESSLKSRDGVFNVGGASGSKDASSGFRKALHSPSARESSIHSVESRSGLVTSGHSNLAQVDGDDQIALSEMRPRDGRYLASVEARRFNNAGGSDNTSGQHIRVNRDISVTHQAGRI
jgi:hypothetical protein